MYVYLVFFLVCTNFIFCSKFTESSRDQIIGCGVMWSITTISDLCEVVMLKELIDVKWGETHIENLSKDDIEAIIEEICTSWLRVLSSFFSSSVVFPGSIFHVFPHTKIYAAFHTPYLNSTVLMMFEI